MNRFRFVVICSLVLLLAFSFSPLAPLGSVRPAAAQYGTCADLDDPGLDGFYTTRDITIYGYVGQSIVVTTSPPASGPSQAMRLHVDGNTSPAGWEEKSEEWSTVPDSLSYTFVEEGYYYILWGSMGDANWNVSGGCSSPPPVDPTIPPVPGVQGALGVGAPSGPIFPPAVFWPGHPDSPAYDGRINAEPADQYVAYCADGQLQVWNGKANVKMGALNYADISAMPDPGSQQIGDTTFLGRSGNILTVNIGPGVWIKDNIKLDKCVAGGYKGK